MTARPQMASAAARRDALLAFLAEQNDTRMDARDVSIVLAHPDDETIACSAALTRLAAATLITVTDGAPRDLRDAHAHGFADEQEYAATRRRELDDAIGLAGMSTKQLVRLEVPDQQAAFRLNEIARTLQFELARRGIRVAITHAYEGGHPDHDATAFAVHAAAARIRCAGGEIAIIEVPLYALGERGPVTCSFTEDGDGGGVVVPLGDAERALKARMVAAHATQAAVLRRFPPAIERYRPAPDYDFARLPNRGRLYYERHEWGLDGVRWQRLAREALSELGRERAC